MANHREFILKHSSPKCTYNHLGNVIRKAVTDECKAGCSTCSTTDSTNTSQKKTEVDKLPAWLKPVKNPRKGMQRQRSVGNQRVEQRANVRENVGYSSKICWLITSRGIFLCNGGIITSNIVYLNINE